MRALLRLLGLVLLIFGIYVLGKDIVFTSQVYPWWRSMAAEGSVVALMAGILMLVFFPRDVKNVGWVSIVIGIVLVFMSSRAILNPTSLWQFILSFSMMAGGYQMLMTGRSPL
jgi:general stress protein CsbA